MTQPVYEFPIPDMANTAPEIEEIIEKLMGPGVTFVYRSIVDTAPGGTKIGYIFQTSSASPDIVATTLEPRADIAHVAQFLAEELNDITPPAPREGAVVGEKTWAIISRYIGDTPAIWAIAGYAPVNTTPQ